MLLLLFVVDDLDLVLLFGVSKVSTSTRVDGVSGFFLSG